MVKKILIATEKPFANIAVENIKKIVLEAGFDIELLESYKDKADLLKAVSEVDAMIVRSDKIDEEVFNAAKNLKIVVRAGAGYDNIDLKAATEHNVVVMNTPGQNANAVAELVIGLLIYVLRGRYNGKSGSELKDKKIGILAFGNVGRNVARIAKGLGMNIYAYDAYCSEQYISSEGVTPVSSMEELFDKCDIISLHIPSTKETLKCINKNLVSRLHEGAVIINSARKDIINEDDLLEFMAERSDIRYITDIMPDKHDDFMKLGERYFSTPKKMGAQTSEANINAGIAAAHQIISYFVDGCEKYRVNV